MIIVFWDDKTYKNMKKRSLLGIAAITGGLIVACTPKVTKTMTEETKTEAVEEVKEEIMMTGQGIDVSLIDKSVDPAEDFYRYVNGKWLTNTEIPSDRTRWGSFDELRKKSSEDVLNVLNAAMQSGKYPKGTDQYKAVEFYKSAMDTAAINKAGLAPIQKYLNEINNIRSLKDAFDYNLRNWAETASAPIGFAVFPDLMNSSVNTGYFVGMSLGLPERDYYIADDEKSVEIRQQYVDHVARMFGFLGVSEADAMDKAKRILELETKLAEPMLTKEESRNPANMYNPKPVADVKKLLPELDWAKFFEAINIPQMENTIVTEVKYFDQLGEILRGTSVKTIKDFYTWCELNSSAAYLSRDIELANFDFYGKTLNGQEQQKPRWERALGQASGMIGEPIGKLYVDEHFPPEAKEKAQAMIANVKEAFANRIKNLEWMTADTKTKALEKLNSFTVKVGYPDKWKDYSNLDIKSAEDGGTYAGNLMAIGKWRFEDSMKKYGKPVDKTEWGMSPQTVNAYYNPLNNEIVFPAAILQPPFYDYKADEAVNYGGIGAVIGHEMSHGFDDQGSRFDAEGNMVNWWTEEDNAAFKARNQKLIDQFNAFEPLPGVFVNGEFTLGENIADLGGVNTAYDGLQLHFAKSGKPAAIDGYTPEQRFFMSWATIWRGKIRDEALITRIKTDPHSPGEYRGNGPLKNLPAFYEAFDVQEGDAMYTPEEDRVMIW